MKKNKRCLALDPGEAIVGYALCENNSDSALDLNVIETGKIPYNKSNFPTKLATLMAHTVPDILAYELSGSCLKNLYDAIVLTGTTHFSVPVLGCKVAHVRQYLFGDSDMPKNEVSQKIKDTFILNAAISKHETDALCIAFYALGIPITGNMCAICHTRKPATEFQDAHMACTTCVPRILTESPASCAMCQESKAVLEDLCLRCYSLIHAYRRSVPLLENAIKYIKDTSTHA